MLGNTSYSLDDMDRVVGVLSPNGGLTQYEYNKNGKLIKIYKSR